MFLSPYYSIFQTARRPPSLISLGQLGGWSEMGDYMPPPQNLPPTRVGQVKNLAALSLDGTVDFPPNAEKYNWI